MLQLELVNDILEQSCENFDLSNPPYDIAELNNSMILFREKNLGLGLAANQVGIPYRVISVKGFDTCLFNPKIVYSSAEEQYSEEGCLSFPNLIVKVKRAISIRVRYTDVYGETSIKSFTGLTARIIQHEIDHLDGKLFYNRANKFHKDQAFRQWKRRKKAA